MNSSHAARDYTADIQRIKERLLKQYSAAHPRQTTDSKDATTECKDNEPTVQVVIVRHLAAIEREGRENGYEMGEFTHPGTDKLPNGKTKKTESEGELVERIFLQIVDIAKLGTATLTEREAKTGKTEYSNAITLVMTPESFWAPSEERGPQTYPFFLKLIEKIETLAKTLPENLHMALGTFLVMNEEREVHHILVYVQCGKMPRIDLTPKRHVAGGDLIYPTGTTTCFSVGGSKLAADFDQGKNFRHCLWGGRDNVIVLTDICHDISNEQSENDIERYIKSATSNHFLYHNVLQLLVSCSIAIPDGAPTALANGIVVQADPDLDKGAINRVDCEPRKNLDEHYNKRTTPLSGNVFGSTLYADVFDPLKVGQFNKRLMSHINLQNELFIQIKAHQLYRAQHPLLSDVMTQCIDAIIMDHFLKIMKEMTNARVKSFKAILIGKYEHAKKNVSTFRKEMLLFLDVKIPHYRKMIYDCLIKISDSPKVKSYHQLIVIQRKLQTANYPQLFQSSDLSFGDPFWPSLEGTIERTRIGNPNDPIVEKMVNELKFVPEAEHFIELLIQMRDAFSRDTLSVNRIVKPIQHEVESKHASVKTKPCLYPSLSDWLQQGLLNQREVEDVLFNQPLVELCEEKIMDAAEVRGIVQERTFYNLIHSRRINRDDILDMKREASYLLREPNEFRHVFINISRCENFTELSFMKKIAMFQKIEHELDRDASESVSQARHADKRRKTEKGSVAIQMKQPVVLEQKMFSSSSSSSESIVNLDLNKQGKKRSISPNVDSEEKPKKKCEDVQMSTSSSHRTIMGSLKADDLEWEKFCSLLDFPSPQGGLKSPNNVSLLSSSSSSSSSTLDEPMRDVDGLEKMDWQNDMDGDEAMAQFLGLR